MSLAGNSLVLCIERVVGLRYSDCCVTEGMVFLDLGVMDELGLAKRRMLLNN